MQKIILSALLVFTFAVQTQIRAQAKNNFAQGELLIQVKPNADAHAIFNDLARSFNNEIDTVIRLSAIMNIYHVTFADKQINLDDLLMVCRSHSSILSAQKNHFVYARETIPSDTLFNNQWHLKNTGQTGGINDADIDAPEAWDITTGGLTTHGDTIVVCIIESNGVDLNHVDLQNNIWRNYAEIPDDGIDNDNNGYVDDYNGWHVITLNDNIGTGSHGTRVAGMIGAKGNNITGISGVNWNVKMMVVQGQSVSNEASVIAAYDYPLTMRKMYNQSNGQEGAFVVATNSSWGMDGGSPEDSPLWCAMYDTLGFYGILNIAATTNDNANVDVVGDLPTTCTSQFLVGVTMTNSQDLRANAGYGVTHVDIAAPGSSVYTTSTSNTYANATGTSFATPCVVGCVALAYSAPCPDFINFVKYNPADAALQMRYYLLESVDQNASLLTEVNSGGRVNVKNYIDSILNACDPNTCIAPYYLNAENISDTAATLTWEGFSTDYIVWFGLNESDLTPINVNTNSLLIDTLKDCHYYVFKLQAVCGLDSSSQTYTYTFQTDGCCKNPPLELVTKTNSSITLDWQNILNGTSYDLRYKHEDSSNWITLLNVTAPLLFDDLLQCSYYEFQIKTNCADSTQGFSTSHLFRTTGCGACVEQTYCDVSGANSNTEWLNSITINDYTNITGNNNGWYVSPGIITALTPGASYNITLIPGYSGFSFTETFSIWVDFNFNGIFETTEKILNDGTASGTFNSIINIPLSATPGVTKMRIGMNGTGSPEVCPIASFYGEYEDYCVYIGPQSGIEETQQNFVSVYPNPVNDFLYFDQSVVFNSIQIFSLSGQLISNVDPLQNKIDMTHFATGTYLIRFTGENFVQTIKVNKY